MKKSVAFLFLILLCLTASARLHADRQKTVVVLYADTRQLPGIAIFDEEFRKQMKQQLGSSVDVVNEFLDIDRHPGDVYKSALSQFLQKKYDRMPVDAVVVVRAPALRFWLAHQSIFDQTPVIYAGISRDELAGLSLPKNVVGIPIKFEPDRLLSTAIQLHRRTEHVVVITGASEHDLFWENLLRQSLKTFDRSVTVEFWSRLSADDIFSRVAQLPKKTIVFTPGIVQDGTGKQFITLDFIADICRLSRRPVYAAYNSAVGHGVVGVYIPPLEEIAGATVGLVHQIVSGTPISKLDLPAQLKNQFIFDWRQLRHFQVGLNDVPPGSIFLYKDEAVWWRYRWYILSFSALCTLEAILIFMLLSNSRMRAQTESKLREIEHALNMAANAANLGLWTWNIKEDSIWATDHGRQLFGFRPNESIYMGRFLQAVHPDDRDRIDQSIKQAVSSGSDYRSEYRIILPNGVVRWISAVGKTARGPSDKVEKMRGIVIDVTDQKRADDRFRLMVESIPNALVMIDEAGDIVLVNSHAESLFGYARSELIGSPIEKLIPERFRNHQMTSRYGFYRDLQSRRMGTGRDLYGLRKDHQEVLIEIGFNPVVTSEGTFVLASIVDMTERHRIEFESDRQRQQLTHLSRVQMLTHFSGSLAHELNQPLTAMLMNTQVARRLLTNAQSNAKELMLIMNDLVTDNRRAADIVHRLRGWLKKEEQQFSDNDLRGLIEEVIQFLRGEFVLNKAHCRIDMHAPVVTAFCDKVQIQQIVLNLIKNALEAPYTHSNILRNIAVKTVFSETDGIVVSVIDDADGMPEATLKDLFNPFVTTKKEGLGMGLSICRTIIEEHGGRIWAAKNADRGMTFSFSLPARVAVAS